MARRPRVQIQSGTVILVSSNAKSKLRNRSNPELFWPRGHDRVPAVEFPAVAHYVVAQPPFDHYQLRNPIGPQSLRPNLALIRHTVKSSIAGRRIT